MNTIITLELI